MTASEQQMGTEVLENTIIREQTSLMQKKLFFKLNFPVHINRSRMDINSGSDLLLISKLKC